MNIDIGIWQIVFIGLIFINIGIAAGKHGQERTDKWNVWAQIVGSVIDIIILMLGGFFS